MKLRKILSGFLAGAVAMSSMVFTIVTDSAETVGTSVKDVHYSTNSPFGNGSEITTIDKVVFNVTLGGTESDGSNGSIYFNIGTQGETNPEVSYGLPGSGKDVELTPGVATDVELTVADGTVINQHWYELGVNNYWGADVTINSIKAYIGSTLYGVLPPPTAPYEGELITLNSNPPYNWQGLGSFTINGFSGSTLQDVADNIDTLSVSFKVNGAETSSAADYNVGNFGEFDYSKISYQIRVNCSAWIVAGSSTLNGDTVTITVDDMAAALGSTDLSTTLTDFQIVAMTATENASNPVRVFYENLTTEVTAPDIPPSSYAITSSQTNGGSFAVTLNNDPDSTEVITEAEAGDEVYIFFNPNIGYELIAYMIRGRVTGDYYANVNSADSEDVSLSDTEYITFEMPEEPVAIVAYFGMVSYDVTVLPYENGTVLASHSIASYGDEIKITATPSYGYEVSSIVVKNDTTGQTIATTDTFLMPDSDVTVEVTFKEVAEEDDGETGEEDDFTGTAIDLGAPDSGWNATFDDATDTINMSEAWGVMYWNNIGDCSDYSKIVLKYSDSTLNNILLTVTYSDNTQDFQLATGANGEITIELDDAKKSDVLNVNIGGSSIPGSVKIISVELITEPMFNKTATEFEAADAGKIVSQTAIVDGKVAKRFTMLVGLDAIKKATKVEFTLSNGTETKVYKTNKYYTSLTASGEEVTAPEGYGFVTLTITDIPDGVTVTCTGIELIIPAN